MDEVIAQRQDSAGLVESHLDVVNLAAFLVGRDEMLAPVLHPLHRAPERDRGVRDEDLLGIEEHDLRPEAATDVGGHDFHGELGQSEESSEAVLDGQGRLRRIPDAQDAPPGVPLGHDAAGLDRAPAAPFDREPLAQDARGACQRGLRVADRLSEARRPIVRHVGVHPRRAARERGRQVGHDRQGLVLHLDERHRVLGDVTTVRDDEGHHLTDVAHLVYGERALGAAVRQGRVRDQQRRRLIQLAELGGRQHEMDAGHAPGGGRVDPRDPCVSVRAPERCGVESARRVHVVHEAAEPLQKSRVLVARNARPDAARGHRLRRGAGSSRRRPRAPGRAPRARGRSRLAAA